MKKRVRSREGSFPVLGSGIAVALCAGALAGCGGSSTHGKPAGGTTGGGHHPSTLTWAVTALPSSVDIARAINGDSVTAQYAVLDTVMTLGADGKLLPRVATSYRQINPTTYVYTIRHGVKFWDGATMTAQDVAYSLERELNPKVASLYRGYALSALKSATATGPYQVTVKLKFPDPTFKYVATEGWQVVQKSFAIKHPTNLGSPSVGTMGTGPYKIASFSAANGMTLVRNNAYWGPKPAAKTIKITAVSDPQSLRLGVQSGSLSGSFDADVDEARLWQSTSGAKTYYAESLGLNYLSFDVTQSPFNNVDLRRAISDAMPRDQLAQTLAGGHAAPAPVMLTQLQTQAVYGGAGGLPSSIPQYNFSLQKAKQELALGHVPTGLKITLSYAGGTPESADIAETLQQNLKQIGITLNLQAVPANQFYNQLYGKGQLGMRLIPSGYETPEPYQSLSDIVGPTAQANYARYKSPTIDRELLAMRTATGQHKKQLTTAVLGELARQAVYLPVDWPAYMIVTGGGWCYQNSTPRTSNWVWHIKDCS